MESMSPMTRWDLVTHGRGSIFSRLLARWKAQKLELKRIQRVCSQPKPGRPVWGGHSCPPPLRTEALIPVTDVTVVVRQVVYLSAVR
jgi:hypothetical protein